MIITRYVTLEITRPFVVIIGLCGVIFASYSTAVLLNEVAAGLLPPVVVAKLVLIKLLIALEILLPVSLYFGIVFGLGRLHSDSELVALSACGVGETTLVATVLRFALAVALVVACLSLGARPWAYQQRYLLLAAAEAEADVDIEDLDPKHFFVGPNADYAVFANAVDQAARTAHDVIVQIRQREAMQVIVAERLFQPPREVGSPLVFVFEEGSVYRLDREGSRDLRGRFGTLRLTLAAPEVDPVGYKSKEQGTLVLSHSSQPKDLAEFQWRLATPLVTVLIALLAVVVSRSPPRRGRFAQALAAVVAYAAFYNVMTFAKNLVQEGFVGAFPGLWWPLVMLGLALSVLFWGPSGSARARRPVP